MRLNKGKTLGQDNDFVPRVTLPDDRSTRVDRSNNTSTKQSKRAKSNRNQIQATTSWGSICREIIRKDALKAKNKKENDDRHRIEAKKAQDQFKSEVQDLLKRRMAASEQPTFEEQITWYYPPLNVLMSPAEFQTHREPMMRNGPPDGYLQIRVFPGLDYLDNQAPLLDSNNFIRPDCLVSFHLSSISM